MVQAIDNNFNKSNYNAVKINISKPEVVAGNANNPNSVATNPINKKGEYNAVSINIDNPTVHAEPVQSIYDYPEAQAPVTYDMAQVHQIPLPQGFNLAYHTTNLILPKMENEIELNDDADEVEADDNAINAGVQANAEDVKTDEKAPEAIEAEPIQPEEVAPEVPAPNFTTTEIEKGEESDNNIENVEEADEKDNQVATEDVEEAEQPEITKDAIESEDDAADKIDDDVKIMDTEVKEIEKKRPEIIKGEEIKPDVDIPLVISNLTNSDYDIQAQQMEEIVRLSMDNQENAIPYIVRDVFSTLIDITKADTAELGTPSDAQVEARKKVIANFITKELAGDNKDVKLPYQLSEADVELANELSPMEQAERNKEYAIYTMSVLAKIYTDEVEKQTGNIVPMTDLPGSSAIVDALRYNPNTGVKIAAIDALSHIERPEYKDELSTLFTLAQTDANPQVAAAAGRALERINVQNNNQ